MSVLQLLWTSSPFIQLIFAALIAMSVVSIYIAVERWIIVAGVVRENRAFTEFWRQSKNLEQLIVHSKHIDGAPVGLRSVFVSIVGTYQKPGSTEQDTHYSAQSSLGQLELTLIGPLPILATIASTAPYVGLLGTVWGIITAFEDIASRGQNSLVAVGPGISEALVATLIGLFAAIVASFNYRLLYAQIQRQLKISETFVDGLLHSLPYTESTAKPTITSATTPTSD